MRPLLETFVAVSVIIPVYRRQGDGEQALRSVLAQTGVDFELIVVDDGSPIPFVVPEDVRGDPRVRLVRQDRNAGAAAARNRGIQEARYDWVAFLDSDDLWRVGKLSSQLAFAQAQRANGGADLCAVMTGFCQTNISGHSLDRIPIDAHRPEDLAAGCWFSPGSTALVARSAFAVVGPFDETLERLEDFDWYLRFGLAGGSVVILKQILVDVRVSSRPSQDKLERSIRRLKSKWLAAQSPLSETARTRLEAYLCVERAAACYDNGEWIGTTSALARSFWLAPRRRVHLEAWWQ